MVSASTLIYGSTEVSSYFLKDKPGHISTKVEELPIPEPGPGQVLVRLTVGSRTLLLNIHVNAALFSTQASAAAT